MLFIGDITCFLILWLEISFGFAILWEEYIDLRMVFHVFLQYVWQIENANEDGDWEYVEEGPAEIIWQRNEIIVKKKRVKVPKRNKDQQTRKEVCNMNLER